MFPNVECLGRALMLVVGLTAGSIIAIWNYVDEPIPIYSRFSWSDGNETGPANHYVANHMRQEIRTLCWIFTARSRHESRAQHIRHTWGQHCNTLLFMSTIEGVSYIFENFILILVY